MLLLALLSCTGPVEPVPDAACRSVGFADDAMDWPLPTLPVAVSDPFSDLDEYRRCGEFSFRSEWLDLTGDGLRDLVVTNLCDAAGVGTTHLLVYENTGVGFAPEPREWGLPEVRLADGLGDEAFADLHAHWGCGAQEFTKMLVDLTVDGRPDLVVTNRCGRKGVGVTHWEVYENTGSGFAPMVEWSLPEPFGQSCQRRSELDYRLMDLRGAGSLQFVVVRPCLADDEDPTYWDVYGNTGTGFESRPERWDLPEPEGPGSCLPEWTTRLTSAERPDLVLTGGCEDSTIGTDRWLVYPNRGDGFERTAIDWRLPELESLKRGSRCEGPGEDRFSYTPIELDGDGRVDFVVTDDCDPLGLGTTHWDVYRAEAAGFAWEPTPFWLPETDLSADPLDWIGGGAPCTRSFVENQIADIDGDGLPDLVLTNQCDFDGVGTTHWLVYRGVCGAGPPGL